MGRKKTITQNNNNKTKLILKGNPCLYFKTQTQIQFKVTKKSPFYKTVVDKPLFPTFNRDRKHYTPTFILPKIQSIKEEQYEALHHQKVAQSLKQFQEHEIMVPKPKSKNRYCGVCRSYYQQYGQHAQSQQHKSSLQNSSFQKYIVKLCHQFQNKIMNICLNEQNKIQRNVSLSTKQNEDENSTESIIDDVKVKI